MADTVPVSCGARGGGTTSCPPVGEGFDSVRCDEGGIETREAREICEAYSLRSADFVPYGNIVQDDAGMDCRCLSCELILDVLGVILHFGTSILEHESGGSHGTVPGGHPVACCFDLPPWFRGFENNLSVSHAANVRLSRSRSMKAADDGVEVDWFATDNFSPLCAWEGWSLS